VDLDPGYLGYRLGSLIARGIPSPAVPTFTRAMAGVANATMADRRQMVERNLRRVDPGVERRVLRRKVDETFDSYTRYWMESFRLPGKTAAAVDRGMTAEGYEHVDAALALGHGVILGLPHLGGWEWGAFWLAQVKGRKVTAVVEPLEPPELAEWFVGLRREIGIEVVPLGPKVAAECLRALRDNQVLCLLCDRDLAGGGIEVDFFGERTTMPGGPATLALRTGAPLIPTAVLFDGTRHRAVVRPALDTTRQGSLRDDVSRITQDLADELEALIRRAPEQWHLMQPNWPSDFDALGQPRPEHLADL